MGLAGSEDEAGIMYVCLAVLCIFCAALAAGLTIGLVSMDRNALRLLLINGTEEEKRQVRQVLPLVKDRHWLLVTLFLFNATANEALPVFLEKIVPGFAAIIASALLVLVFGEIIPSSIFGGRRQLQLAAKLSWVVRILFVLLFVIAKPIAVFLDYWIGKHEDNIVPFNAKDLYTLLGLSACDTSEADVSPVRPPSARQGRGRHKDGSSRKYGMLSSSSEHSHGQVSTGEEQAEDASVEVTNALQLEGDGMATVKAAETEMRNGIVNRRAPAGCANSDVSDCTDSHSVDIQSIPDFNKDGSRSHRAPSFLHSINGERILLDRLAVSIAQGAIVCSRKTVTAITIRPEKYFSVDGNDAITLELLESIGNSRFSRIIVRNGPLAAGTNVLGYILVKEIVSKLKIILPHIIKNASEVASNPLLIKSLKLYDVKVVGTALTVLEALNCLKSGDSGIAVVTNSGDKDGELLGFFSMEDIMEEIIQDEIADEKDCAKFNLSNLEDNIAS